MIRNNSLHRIHNFALLKIEYANKVDTFYRVKDEIALENNHYFHISTLNNIIWDSGTHNHRLNKIYSEPILFTPDNETFSDQMRYINVHLLLREHFSWDNLFGLLVIVKSLRTNEILISKLCNVFDFTFASRPEYIGNSLWTEETILKIPEISDDLVCEIVEVKNIDISNSGENIGYIYNFPVEFITLIDEKPTPDYIKVLADFNDNQFLYIRMSTTENKTVEQSILDYFELKTANIDVSYIVNYGNNSFGFNSIRIKNEMNKFFPIVFGLNFSDMLEYGTIDIIIIAEIWINSTLMKREIRLVSNLAELNAIAQSHIYHPESNYPVEIVNQTVVNNTIIDTKETTKIKTILQPIFAELISKDFVFETKNIYFNELVSQTILQLEKTDKDPVQNILSKITADNVIYFDLSELKPITKNTIYRLINPENGFIIGSGNINTKFT